MIVDVDQAAQTLFAALTETEDEIAQSEVELADLRDKQRRLRTAVKALAPELLEETATTKPKKPKGLPPVGRQTLEDVRVALGRTIANGTQFAGLDLKAKIPDLPEVPTLNVALRHLHANGELRLVRQERGGKKVYEVIR